MNDSPDPITSEWFLVKSLKLPICLISIYVWFVLKAGPIFMKDRAPFVLKKIIIAYNLFQVVLNLTLLLKGWHIISTYNLKCQPTDFSTSPLALSTRNMSWYFYTIKYLDLLDTVFFILRKKTGQITFLHVFHHAFVPLYLLLNVKYQPGGHGVIPAYLNAAVHAFMYLYYGIAALGPKYQKYLWWKRHLTEMQLVQFVIIIMHSGQLYFRDCAYPLWLVHIHVTTSALFLYLFGRFYYRMYLKKETGKLSKHL